MKNSLASETISLYVVLLGVCQHLVTIEYSSVCSLPLGAQSPHVVCLALLRPYLHTIWALSCLFSQHILSSLVLRASTAGTSVGRSEWVVLDSDPRICSSGVMVLFSEGIYATSYFLYSETFEIIWDQALSLLFRTLCLLVRGYLLVWGLTIRGSTVMNY